MSTNLVVNTAGAAVLTATAVPTATATVKAYAANVLNTVVTFIHHSTRGTTAYLGFALQGVKGQGVIFAPAAQFNGIVPATLAFSVLPVGSVIPAGSTLLTRGNTGIAKGTRTAYAAMGCPAIVFHNALLPSPTPEAMVVNVVLTAVQRNANTTAAVVAAANVAVATATATPVLAPAAVAAVAAVAAAKVVATATAKPVGKTAAQRNAHGKTA